MAPSPDFCVLSVQKEGRCQFRCSVDWASPILSFFPLFLEYVLYRLAPLSRCLSKVYFTLSVEILSIA